MKRLTLHLLVAGVVSALAALVFTAAAMGGVSGPCSATFAGANVADRGTGATSSPITVGHDASVPIVMSTSGRLTHVRITIEFAGFAWVVKDKAVSTPVYRDTIPVKDYATYGVGLYKVEGQGTGPGLSCTGGALVKVKGNPVTSIAGGIGLGAVLVGGLGLLAGALGRGLAPSRIARSSLAGLVTAFGGLVLLQQTAILYPTALVAAVGLAIGFGAGTALPFVRTMFRHGARPTTLTTGRPATPAV